MGEKLRRIMLGWAGGWGNGGALTSREISMRKPPSSSALSASPAPELSSIWLAQDCQLASADRASCEQPE